MPISLLSLVNSRVASLHDHDLGLFDRNVEGLVHPQRNILPFMSFQTCMTKSGLNELY